jgi:hypothetical protein
MSDFSHGVAHVLLILAFMQLRYVVGRQGTSLKLENMNNTLFRNLGNKLPTYAA